MGKPRDVLAGTTGSHVAPFLWVHGETEERYRELVRKISEAGIMELCIEARPHSDFAGPGWWHDLGIILDECRTLDMGVWLLDDSHFPTGFANGEVKRSHPELCKRYLHLKTFDVAGPLEGGALNLRYAFQSADDEIVGIFAQRRAENDTPVPEETIDLTGLVRTHCDFLTGKPAFDPVGNPLGFDEQPYPVVDLTLPAGLWYVNVLTVSYKGGEKETEGYLNPLEATATQVLIDTVYQPMYDHFASDFGTTFRGFFSDEPRLGNIHGSENASIGRNPQMNLSWTDGMLELLAKRCGGFGAGLGALDAESIKPFLPLLFFGESEAAHALRYAYMDVVSQLYSDNFDGVLSNWCEEHGVRKIGHTVEDNNAISRLGYGCGHIMRAEAHSHMAGVDVVFQQLMPGYDQGYFRSMHNPGWEMSFFSHVLAKVGGSLAHLDATRKQGECMAEVFGAFGWTEGTRLEKWLLDHMLSRGVTFFVPHAFTGKAFPDSDCPPHFWADGHDPQWREFGLLMAYAQRMGDLFSGGRYDAPVALWLNAEAEWSGDWQLVEKPARALACEQVEYDLVSSDYLKQARVEGDRALIGEERFRAVVVPWAEAMPETVLAKLLELAKANIPVLFIDALPVRSSEATDVSDVLLALADTARVTPLDELAEACVALGLRELAPGVEQPWLRTYHYVNDGVDAWLLLNEDVSARVTCTLTGASEGHVYTYDAWTDALYEDADAFSIDLAPLASKVVLVSAEPLEGTVAAPQWLAAHEELPLGACTLSLASHEGLCAEWSEPVTLDSPTYVTSLPGHAGFGGRARYRFTAELNDEQVSGAAELVLAGAREGAWVTVNSVDCGTVVSGDYRFAIPVGTLQVGENDILVEVNSTLGRAVGDYFGQFMPMEPVGITGAALRLA